MVEIASVTPATSRTTARPVTLGDHVAAARKAKGFRQTDMARAMPCDQFRYQCIESGRDIPTVAQRRRIAALLDLDDAELAVLPTRVVRDLDGRVTRELNQQPTADEDDFELFAVPADRVVAEAPEPRQPTSNTRRGPTQRYRLVGGAFGPELTEAVNDALARIQSHRNAPIGSHTTANPMSGQVVSVTTIPAGDEIRVAIVYVADRDVFTTDR